MKGRERRFQREATSPLRAVRQGVEGTYVRMFVRDGVVGCIVFANRQGVEWSERQQRGG